MPHHDNLAFETAWREFHQPYSNHPTMCSMRLPLPTASTLPSHPLKANGQQNHEAQEMWLLLCMCNLQQFQHWPLPIVQLLQQKLRFHYGQTETSRSPIVRLLESVRRLHCSRKLGVCLSSPVGCQMYLLKLVGCFENVSDHGAWSWWGLNPAESTWQLGGGWEYMSQWLPAVGQQSYPW